MRYQADIIAKLNFYPSTEGGLVKPWKGSVFSCAVQFDGNTAESYDCSVLLKNVLFPGDRLEAEISFLDPSSVADHLSEGSKFKLCYGRCIGDGVLERVLRKPTPGRSNRAKVQFA